MRAVRLERPPPAALPAPVPPCASRSRALLDRHAAAPHGHGAGWSRLPRSGRVHGHALETVTADTTPVRRQDLTASDTAPTSETETLPKASNQGLCCHGRPLRPGQRGCDRLRPAWSPGDP